MRGKTHIALAIAIPVALNVIPASPESWAGLVVGALLPDIDTRGAIARPVSTFFSKLLPQPLTAALDRIGLTIARWAQHLLGHRGVLHYPLWGFLLIWSGIALAQPWVQWLGCGYILHIIGDSLTPSGAPIFGPIFQRPIHLASIKTGSSTETALALSLWAFIILQTVSPLTAKLTIGW